MSGTDAGPAWVDAHCHLELREYPATAEVIQRAREAGVVRAVVVDQFHGPGDFGTALEVARAHPDFLAPTMGIHPHEAAGPAPADWEALERLCAEPDVRAVGEAGLDYLPTTTARPGPSSARLRPAVRAGQAPGQAAGGPRARRPPGVRGDPRRRRG